MPERSLEIPSLEELRRVFGGEDRNGDDRNDAYGRDRNGSDGDDAATADDDP